MSKITIAYDEALGFGKICASNEAISASDTVEEVNENSEENVESEAK